jgi:hypothetical protein
MNFRDQEPATVLTRNGPERVVESEKIISTL